jgi:16S rRNA (adenine1518-N6/adenine1519-N6)-dimethyltransferase
VSRPISIKSTLATHRLAPSKRLGQNFLIHRSTAEAIVETAGFDCSDRVIEVGVGLGALTVPLASAVASVIGIEIDRGIIRYHEQERLLPANVSLIHGDILRLDLAKLIGPTTGKLKIIANLPYSISNPFIFRMIELREMVDQVVVMLQKEVADRLHAAPGTKPYGIPTVLLGCCARVETLMTLDRSQFHPRPKIDSQVIRIRFHEPQPDDRSFRGVQQLVRAAFANRRKTLLNNLLSAAGGRTLPQGSESADSGGAKMRILQAIESLDLPLNIRGEVLTVNQFQQLAATLGAWED